MKIAITILLLCVLLASCDCMQQVEGVVIDKETGMPVKAVVVYKEGKDPYKEKTDEAGRFKLSGISGNLFGTHCPPMNVVFERKEYETQHLTFQGYKQIELAPLHPGPGYDTNVIVVLPFDTATMAWLPGHNRPASLEKKDYRMIQELLAKQIDSYNVEERKRFVQWVNADPSANHNENDFIINLQHYKRQYEVYTNEKGEKIVWINCFCVEGSFGENWKNGLVWVMDGGNCYFNVKVNLTTHQCFDMMVNGVA